MTDSTSTPLLNRSKVRRSQHFPRLDVSNECQYVTRSVMRQISRNLVVFMSASPCTSNYETGSYVVRVKVMSNIQKSLWKMAFYCNDAMLNVIRKKGPGLY